MTGKKKYLFIAGTLLALFLQGCGKSGEGEVSAPEPPRTQETAEAEAQDAGENVNLETAAPEEHTQTSEEIQAPAESVQPDAVEQAIAAMSLEDKVAQLFVIQPEALTEVDAVTAAGEMTKEAYDETPVGGFIYMEQNLQEPEQVREMLENIQSYSRSRTGFPVFACVDEEGGTVARINNNPAFSVPAVGDMAELGAAGDVSAAGEAGSVMGAYLADLGFNVDFAPVADVLSNPDNEVVRQRSFGSDPELVAEMSEALRQGLEENGVFGVLKHFPGHGATEGDTHEGYAYTSRSAEELAGCEWIPFQRGIAQGAGFIMVGHISLPNVIGDDTPASLSAYVITDILRGQLGYDGIVVTDALNMGAISQYYAADEAAVKVLEAGADLILMPADFRTAYQGVLHAVNDQTLSEERIDESLRRILTVKQKMMQN